MSTSDFINTYLNPIKIMESKREYRKHMARVKALPEDYRFVFEKIQHYMWMFAGGDGMDMMKLQYDIIELFEEGAASGKQVLEITGDDVVGFCDGLLQDTKKWMDGYRENLNRDILKKLKNEDDTK